MTIYFTVQPRGSKFRVVDYEGKVIGLPFDFRDSAQSYADALNQARNRRAQRNSSSALANGSAIGGIDEAGASPEPTIADPSLLTRLRTLGAKALSYKMVRLGL